MLKKEMICIVCPNSCRLSVWEEEGRIRVEGASCARGMAHGRNEFTHPVRMLTSTVRLEGARHRRLAVISSQEIPKEKIREALAALEGVTVSAPVRKGDIIVRNISGSGADIVASRTIPAAE